VVSTDRTMGVGGREGIRKGVRGKRATARNGLKRAAKGWADTSEKFARQKKGFT